MSPKDEDQTETEQTEASGPMLDMSQADVKKMIAKAKAKGYITYDELNRVLPSDQFSSKQIDDVMSLLSEMGVNVVEDEGEGEEGPAAEAGSPRAARSRPRPPPRPKSTAPTTRCAFICARWARSCCCRARARSPSPSASRPVGRP